MDNTRGINHQSQRVFVLHRIATKKHIAGGSTCSCVSTVSRATLLDPRHLGRVATVVAAWLPVVTPLDINCCATVFEHGGDCSASHIEKFGP